MTFRPQIVLTVATLATLGFLIWLGAWQLQRAEWKSGLIADFERRTSLESVDWQTGVCDQLGAEGTPTPPMSSAAIDDRIAQAASPTSTLRVFGRSPAGQVGWRILHPLPLAECSGRDGVILVEFDFEPEQVGPVDLPRIESDVRYHAAPWPERPAMAASNDPEANEWYWFDADRMAATLGEPDLERSILVVPFAGMPDYLTRTPPVRHISYAVTWFGLAICLLIVYVVIHVRAGRLSLKS